MTLRVGDREIIKPRQLTRLATGMSLTSGVYATNIPPFDPMRFFSAAEPNRGPEPPPETADADVSVVKSDLASIVLEPTGPTLSDAAVAERIEAEIKAANEAGLRAVPNLPLPAFLPRVLGVGDVGSSPLTRDIGAPFRSIEVRVVPENVTDLQKTTARAADAFEDRTIPLKRGDPLDPVLRANGALPDEIRGILAALGARDRSGAAFDSLQLRLLLAPPAQPSAPRRIARVLIVGERGIEAIAALNDRNVFVSVAPPAEAASAPKPQDAEDEEDDSEGGVRLYESLYETALKHDLPRQTIDDLVRIFGYDVDFQRRVTSGDSMELFYATDEDGGAERIEVLEAALTIGNEVRRVFRFQGEDGTVDYLDEAGRSLRKFLMRKPITDAKVTSGFGSRYHPILGYAKMHTGVDWGSKIGTPILAAGNGTVAKAEWAGGYGRRTEIQHANGYVTAYNHQSGFARGIAPGARVRQGQVIGYVGTTGLSTGPHLHYEVIVNGRFVDPMKIRVPRGKELDGRALADFGRQKDQILALEKRGASGGFSVSEAR